MPFWPFKKRRRSGIRDGASQPIVVSEKEPPTEQFPRTATHTPPPPPSQPMAIPRKSSRREGQLKRRASQENEKDAVVEGAGKENVQPRHRPQDSRDDTITALPMSWKLEHSPHLRPIDADRPHIPYNFRQPSTSQASIPRDQATSLSPRPHTLQKRPSAYSSNTPQRRRSSRRRKEDDHVREEEIRAMSAQTPIPKRPGAFNDSPLRRDSKKMRSIRMKDSTISLPPQDSVHETMSSISEQRGWEIGSLDMFNPRPAVRLSGVPQHVTSSSQPSTSAASPEPLLRKDKKPVSRGSEKRKELIGNQADDFDASDLRMLMERDSRRREKRKKETHEKLDRKLRSRNGRNRGDSDRNRREAEEERKVEDARREEEVRQREEEELRRGEETRQVAGPSPFELEAPTAPSAVHPALRSAGQEQPKASDFYLPPAAIAATAGVSDMQYELEAGHDDAVTELEQDPFADPEHEHVLAPHAAQHPPGAFSPVQTPMEDPVLFTAEAVQVSQASAPLLSPVQSNRATSNLAQVTEAEQARQLPSPPPISEPRRASQPSVERRPGTWATFFRRGGTNLKKSDDGRFTPSDSSFSNASRESMRNQALPAHLVDTQADTSLQVRRASGTPVRTQSRFREDLPEMPMSPPDSRFASPEATSALVSDLAARRSPVPMNIDRKRSGAGSDSPAPGRYDTPVSPPVRMTSMASVDSEGSWFGSGSIHRHSVQSSVGGRIGSGALGQRRPEFTDSYEELGGDRDAEHFSRAIPSVENDRTLRSRNYDEDEERREFYDSPPDPASSSDPLTIVGSVRRKPTLVHRDPRIKSREGLLTEDMGQFESADPSGGGGDTGRSSIDLDSDPEIPEPEMKRATSVDYGRSRGHSRQWSAGSAKLLDVPSRRASRDLKGQSEANAAAAAASPSSKL